MPRKIFYSWQSWLPRESNRSLIHDALEAACDEIAVSVSEAQRPEVDHDTLGVPGAPDVAQTIFSKIDTCDAFVADVSLIACEGGRFTPNPNVLIELGYAVKTLGWERVIFVLNTHFGPPEALPFDLKTKRGVKYSVDPSGAPNGTEEELLRGELKERLKEILDRSPVPEQKSIDQDVVRSLQLIRGEVEQMAARAEALNNLFYAPRPTTEWAEQVLRLLRLRFNPDMIERVLPNIADELHNEEHLRQQLHIVRTTARAADLEADRFVKECGTNGGWSDTTTLHRQIHELLNPTRLVVQAIDRRLAALERRTARR